MRATARAGAIPGRPGAITGIGWADLLGRLLRRALPGALPGAWRGDGTRGDGARGGAWRMGMRARGVGSISLVGAGPGARDLMTLRAAERLAAADVVFYDRLVDPEVLRMVRPGAERVDVGKAVGACAWPQERIDAVIVAAALAGRRVVRLKSGDPGLFGRATEELAAARAAGVAVEIVPGVTAASAAGAALGRSLTERGSTDRVVFATGTCRAGDAAPDWGAMLAPGTTLALYMAVRKAGEIAANLRAAGVPDDCEVEIVERVSTAAERRVATTLGGLCATMACAAIANPAILLVRRPKAVVVAVERVEMAAPGR